MAALWRGRCRSIRRGTAPMTSATSRCCWRASRRPSWRGTASRALNSRGRRAPASSSWTTASRIRDCARTAPSWWWMARAASAMAGCFPQARCGRRWRRSFAARRRFSWSAAAKRGTGWRARRGLACRCSGAGSNRTRRRSPPCGRGRCWPLPASAIRRNSSPRLRNAGIEVGASVGFADHHRYRRHEASDLIERAERAGMTLVTTEKDLARMAGQNDVAALAGVARALPVTLQVAEEAAFRDWVLA